MKKSCFLFFLVISGTLVLAQQGYEPAKENLTARQDFQDRKFGLFIHWGVYSILGDGEWVMHNEHIPYKSYSKLPAFFYPYAFDAKEWVDMVKAAGMKYITITSRHHDGFSMFQTKASPYNIVDATQFHKDPLKELAEECHRQGIKLFFYYSLLDWGRPDYGFGKPIENGKPADTDWDHYIRFMKDQLTELLTNYGEIAGIWFDGEWERKANWHFDEIYTLIHHLQPQALIGNNHHHDPRDGEDFQMFEKDLPGNNSTGWITGGVSKSLPLETCETMNNNWGFTINDQNYKTIKDLIHYLVNGAGRNGNFLLNVGPMPNGKVQPEFKDTLAGIGAWLAKYGESIYGTRGNVIPPQPWGTVTSKGKFLYVHLLNRIPDGPVFLPGIQQKIVKAATLEGDKNIKFKQQAEGIFIYPGNMATDGIDAIIKLEAK
ncbi:MAG: alpha-L-fucosidase [Ginsengibacter sp.]